MRSFERSFQPMYFVVSSSLVELQNSGECIVVGPILCERGARCSMVSGSWFGHEGADRLVAELYQSSPPVAEKCPFARCLILGLHALHSC